MLRTIALTMVLILTASVMLPFANSAHGLRQSTQIGMRKHRRYHSRAWWRRYRTRLRKKAIDDGMITLRESGLHKIRNGLTTLEEVVRETVA